MRNFFTRTLILISLCTITSACEEFKRLQNSPTSKISNTPEVENVFNEKINSEIKIGDEQYKITEEYTSATGSTCRAVTKLESEHKKIFCKDKGKIHEYRYLK